LLHILSVNLNILRQTTAAQLEIVKTEQTKPVDLRPPVPGLAPRPPPPIPTNLVPPADPDTSGSTIPTCPSCAPLREALRQAHKQLRSAQTCIDGAVILGNEAIHRSSIKVDAYEILDEVRSKHGIPFEDGRSLPEEYKNYFPRHKYHDGILRAVERRAAAAATVESRADAEAKTQPQPSNDPHSDGDHRACNETPDDHAVESDESVPEGFRPSSSEGSDSENPAHALDRESDDDGNWEEAVRDSDLEGDDEGSAGEDGNESDSE